MSDLNIVVAGAAGQGVQSSAGILGKALLHLGFDVYVTQDYQSRIRGGHNFMRVRFSDRPLGAAVKRVDFLLALNEESLHIHFPDVVQDGQAIIDYYQRPISDAELILTVSAQNAVSRRLTPRPATITFEETLSSSFP